MKEKSGLRQKADQAKKMRCKDLIAVLENPKDRQNVASVIRNIDALGVEKLYVVDGYNILPRDWETQMRENKTLNAISVSAIKYTFVKTFKNTEECASHLKRKGFISKVTSPHLKDQKNSELANTKFTEKRIAIWFGNESKGISDEAIQNSVECIQIPMAGIIESLNLATSTGIVLYEATKQRRNFKK
jgi:tRNA (guanosine-2'-O-)-methyltransferase